MIAFDCIARRAVLGERGIRNEIDQLAAMAAGAPLTSSSAYSQVPRTPGWRYPASAGVR